MIQTTLCSVRSNCRPVHARQLHEETHGGSERLPQLDDASIDHLFDSFESLSAKSEQKWEPSYARAKQTEWKQRETDWLSKILSSLSGRQDVVAVR